MSHTPGPWEVKEYKGSIEIRGYNYIHEHIASCGAVCDENDANARLIAAAPEMYALLVEVPHNNMSALHRMIGHVAGCRGCEARALLAKIDGAS